MKVRVVGIIDSSAPRDGSDYDLPTYAVFYVGLVVQMILVALVGLVALYSFKRRPSKDTAVSQRQEAAVVRFGIGYWQTSVSSALL